MQTQHFSEEARSGLINGIKKLSDAVSCTVGPKGRHVVIRPEYGQTYMTNDGVTIARSMKSDDLLEDSGMQLIRQAAMKTNDEAGDGTSTSTVLAYAMVEGALSEVKAGANPVSLSRGMNAAVSDAVSSLRSISKPIASQQDIVSVATISSRSKDLGRLVADAFERVGKDGVVTVEAGRSVETTVDVKSGMSIDSGFVSPYMAEKDGKYVSRSIPVLITNETISTIHSLIPIVEQVSAGGERELLVIASSFDNEAITNAVVNKMNGKFNLVFVKAPEFGDRRDGVLQDIAIFSGGTVMTKDIGGVASADASHLGRTSVAVSKSSCVLTDGRGEKEDVDAACNQIRADIETAKDGYAKQKLEERLARLSGGIAVISAGGATEVEMIDTKYRIEDAIGATKSAMAEGIIPGGGNAMARIAYELLQGLDNGIGIVDEDEKAGYAVVCSAMLEPIRCIVENAGEEWEDSYLGEDGVGYNADTGRMENLLDVGVIDPTKVARCALQNAVSVASSIITTEAAIINSTPDE